MNDIAELFSRLDVQSLIPADIDTIIAAFREKRSQWVAGQRLKRVSEPTPREPKVKAPPKSKEELFDF